MDNIKVLAIEAELLEGTKDIEPPELKIRFIKLLQMLSDEIHKENI